MRKLAVLTVAITLTASGAAFAGSRHVAFEARASARIAEAPKASSEAIAAQASAARANVEGNANQHAFEAKANIESFHTRFVEELNESAQGEAK